MKMNMAFNKTWASEGRGSGLKATTSATTIRTRGGEKTVHDSPFAETKEQLGGYYRRVSAISISRKVRSQTPATLLAGFIAPLNARF